MEDQRHRAFLEQEVERDVAVILVLERKGRSFLADGKAGLFRRGGFGGPGGGHEEQPASGESCGESGGLHGTVYTHWRGCCHAFSRA
jgi:hypothetical protein